MQTPTFSSYTKTFEMIIGPKLDHVNQPSVHHCFYISGKAKSYIKIGQGNQWLRPAGTTCDFRTSHCMAKSANCICPTGLPFETKIAPHVSIFSTINLVYLNMFKLFLTSGDMQFATKLSICQLRNVSAFLRR